MTAAVEVRTPNVRVVTVWKVYVYAAPHHPCDGFCVGECDTRAEAAAIRDLAQREHAQSLMDGTERIQIVEVTR